MDERKYDIKQMELYVDIVNSLVTLYSTSNAYIMNKFVDLLDYI